MKQSLNLTLGHKLKLTPRLQQAISLLQLSSLDLQTEIQTALENNPFLEQEETETLPAEPLDPDPGNPSVDAAQEDGGLRFEDDNNPSDDSGFEDAATNTDDDSPEVDWSEPNTGVNNAIALSTRDSHDYSAYLENCTGIPTLADHLKEQIHATVLEPQQILIAEALIENINHDGYLETGDDALIDLVPSNLGADSEMAEAVLEIIQGLDPAGIGARSLQECLLIQVRQLLIGGSQYDDALSILRDHFKLLSNRDQPGLKRSTGLDQENLQAALEVIRSLDPKPASRLDNSPVQYVVPDLVVRLTSRGWQVELNGEAQTKINISPACSTYLSAKSDREDSIYFKQRHQEAKWFMQSLRQRNDTILRVGREIVRHQRGFLQQGDSAMRPLTLRQIADTLDMHESTVSRATSQKYILSPRGIHELKYFFSSQLGSEQDGGHSATAVQAKIRKLISEEPAGKPVSDQKISDFFKNQGICVARRTVAKYREQMHILSSSQRKGFL